MKHTRTLLLTLLLGLPSLASANVLLLEEAQCVIIIPEKWRIAIPDNREQNNNRAKLQAISADGSKSVILTAEEVDAFKGKSLEEYIQEIMKITKDDEYSKLDGMEKYTKIGGREFALIPVAQPGGNEKAVLHATKINGRFYILSTIFTDLGGKTPSEDEEFGTILRSLSPVPAQ